MNENGRHFVNLANSRLLEIIHLEKKVKDQQAEIEQLTRLLDEHPSWSVAAIKKQFLYLTQKASEK